MILEYKILKNTSARLCSKRHKRKVYHTNRFGKDLAFFYALKTLTTSGHISCWRQQFDQITEVTKIRSLQTVYTRLKRCQKLGLLQLNNTNISLISFEKLSNILKLNNPEFSIYEYDTKKPLQTPEYFLKLASIEEAKAKRLYRAKQAIDRNSTVKEILRIEDKVTNADVERLHQLQVSSFKFGKEFLGLSTDEYKLLHSINPDLELTAKSIKRLFGFKSFLSACYLKGELAHRKLADVATRKLTSSARMRKEKGVCWSSYNPLDKTTFWQLPDSITSLVACQTPPQIAAAPKI